MLAPRKNILAACTAAVLAMLTGCDATPVGHGDMNLPAGDAAQGRELFISLGCADCHNVVGAELPDVVDAGQPRVLLGSTAGRSMTYGRLVTSVVNPSHKLTRRYKAEDVSVDGESLMRSYNDVITITELTHLVAFLQAHYEAAQRPGYKYRVYDYSAADEQE